MGVLGVARSENSRAAGSIALKTLQAEKAGPEALSANPLNGLPLIVGQKLGVGRMF